MVDFPWRFVSLQEGTRILTSCWCHFFKLFSPVSLGKVPFEWVGIQHLFVLKLVERRLVGREVKLINQLFLFVENSLEILTNLS